MPNHRPGNTGHHSVGVSGSPGPHCSSSSLDESCHEPTPGRAAYLWRRPVPHDPAPPQNRDPIRDLQCVGGITSTDRRPAASASAGSRRQIVDQQQVPASLGGWDSHPSSRSCAPCCPGTSYANARRTETADASFESRHLRQPKLRITSNLWRRHGRAGTSVYPGTAGTSSTWRRVDCTDGERRPADDDQHRGRNPLGPIAGASSTSARFVICKGE